VFNRDTSGWYGEPHYFDGPHREYNQGVMELWNKNHYNPSKMTKKDAQDFIDQVMSSRDPRIAEYRNFILDKCDAYARHHEAWLRGGKAK
jgi:hypothetical protein